MSRLMPQHWSVVTWLCVATWLLFALGGNLGGASARNHGYAVDEAYTVVSGFPLIHTEYWFAPNAPTANRTTSGKLIALSMILNVVAIAGVAMLCERWTRRFSLWQMFLAVTIIGAGLSIYGRWAFAIPPNLASRVETFILVIYFGPATALLLDMAIHAAVTLRRRQAHALPT